MAIRVVARIRPQQKSELSKEVIVSTARVGDASLPNLVKIPNPKNIGEEFSFLFSSVYDSGVSQQDLFDHEISPTIKHLFRGFDITIFAYGSTGTGKTHTMRGGKTLAERGIIPRLLSGIYRRARKIEKDSNGETSVEITLSYYEIYNDKVFDLFEAPDMRSLSGLALRDNGTKTVIVGLTEKPCESLKDFERLYDQANVNRSTSATKGTFYSSTRATHFPFACAWGMSSPLGRYTRFSTPFQFESAPRLTEYKLNSASSRSHAILRIKLTITAGDEVRISTTSAIDLAGSEDNRRTENSRDRMVESASINKSLFTLAKCVEAISQNQSRIPYRESKMTRILSLGQNNGLTVMILNLAPVRSYHLDTLSSLNFANRTKQIEVREVENEPIFRGCSRAVPSSTGETIQRQPLRPLANTSHNVIVARPAQKQNEKPKAFAVYSDKSRLSNAGARLHGIKSDKRSPLKRPSDPFTSSAPHPKRRSPDRSLMGNQHAISKQAIEDIIERKVSDILAAKALDQPSVVPQPEISEEVRRRLELLEQKIEGNGDGREQGLTFLLCAKQHSVRGEDGSALKMYALAKNFFPDNKKLDHKIEQLHRKLQLKKQEGDRRREDVKPKHSTNSRDRPSDDDHKEDGAIDHDQDDNTDDGFHHQTKRRKLVKERMAGLAPDGLADGGAQSPGTKRLLDIINTRDAAQIRLLRGVGAKKAEGIVEALCSVEGREGLAVRSLGDLGRLKGVGMKTMESMRAGLLPASVSEQREGGSEQ